jgi:hypothetical protein
MLRENLRLLTKNEELEKKLKEMPNPTGKQPAKN